MIDTIATQTATASPTAAVCESMALYGAAPERGELDSRVVWDEDDAIDALSEAIRIIVEGVTVDGTQMADERESLLWGFVNKPDASPPGAVLSDLEPSGVYFSMPYARTGVLPFTVWNPPERPRVCFSVLSAVLTNATPNVIFAA
ncbi:MAG: hypothetical protein OXF79_25545 [Chloroflexi bacterium]|nr:hypothetical protein [Chloroflexota bacterium]